MCTRCSKSFSTESAKDAHVRICGVRFTCNCSKVFSTYEALLTHAKRYQHVIDNKYKLLLKYVYLLHRSDQKLLILNSFRKTKSKVQPAIQVTLLNVGKPVTILPNDVELSKTYAYDINGKLKVTCDAAMQTDELKRTKKASSPSKSGATKRRISQQTQTGGLKNTGEQKHRKKTCAETQTNERFIGGNKPVSKEWKCKRSNGLTKELESTILKEDINFVDNFESQNIFSNSPLPLSHDVGLQDLWEVKNTSGTQTSDDNLLEDLNENDNHRTDMNIFYNHDEPTLMNCGSQTTNLNNIQYMEENSIGTSLSFAVGNSDSLMIEKMFDNKFSSIETQTELEFTRQLFTPDEDHEDTSFTFSSNTETQTTESFDNIEQLLYSNTCTQTSDEILLSDLGFSDIQTQTAWPQISDATVSTETQTRISKTVNNVNSIGKSWLNAQTNHMETQTELLNFFEQLN